MVVRPVYATNVAQNRNLKTYTQDKLYYKEVESCIKKGGPATLVGQGKLNLQF